MRKMKSLHDRSFLKMPHYSAAERICILEAYLSTKSYNQVREIFRHRFPNLPNPTNSTIMRLTNKFRETGSVANQVHHRRPSILTEEKVTEIMECMVEDPRLSVRKLASQVDVSYKTAYRAVREHLQLFPYKVCAVHQLLPADHQQRIHFCEWLSEVLEHDATFLETCYFSDEAWFHLNGYVNSQNTRYWSATNPHEIHEEPLHSSKVGVWAAFSAKRIFITFFDTTVTAATYCALIDQFVGTFTEDDIAHGWLQQDNAPGHTANQTLWHLQLYFGDRVISKGLWPPRSPDLSPPDYFLWGYLKGRVYANKPTSLAQLRQNIQIAVSEITPVLLNSVMHSLSYRMQMCILVQGGHFQHL